MQSRLTQVVESKSRAKKVVEDSVATQKKVEEDLEMARAEAISRNSRIFELELPLKEVEIWSLKSEEGQA